MSDRKFWIHAGLMHVPVLALAACVLPPVQEPATCPPGAHLRETAQGPLCVAGEPRPGPGPSEPVAMFPDDRDPPPAPPEPPDAPPPPPVPPPGTEPVPAAPPPPGPGARVDRGRQRDGLVSQDIKIEAGVLHGAWMRRDGSGRMVDKGFFDMGWPAGEWSHWDEQGNIQHTCVFQRDAELLVSCQVYRAGILAGVQSYIDRRPWPARSLDDLVGLHAMSNLEERHGPSITYETRTGRQQSEGSYDHGKENGVWTRWSLNGHMRLQESYRDGQHEGPYTEWHENGQQRQHGIYSAGRKHGVWTTWSESGVVLEKVAYEMGVEHGSAERFHPDGKPKERGSYENGKKTGVWETWHEDGSLRWRGQYMNGRPQGPWEIRDEDGRVARGEYVDGKRQGAWELLTPAGWERGKDMRTERGHYEGGRRHGVWITLGPGGWKHSEGRYEGGQRVGRWMAWSQGDRVIADVSYHESGKLHGSFTRWHDNGVIAEQGELVDGVKVGTWIAHNPDGSVLYRGSYRDGEKHGPWLERVHPNTALDERLYDHGKVIECHGYELHVALGFLQAPGRDAAVQDVFSVDIAAVREHRQDDGRYFLGYGIEGMIESSNDRSTTVALGVPLRLGAMTTVRRRRSGLAHGTYGYAQVTPYLRLGDGGPDPGARVSIGLTSPAYSRFLVKPRVTSDSDQQLMQWVLYPVLLAAASINHVELVYEHDQTHGAQVGVMFGFGL